MRLSKLSGLVLAAALGAGAQEAPPRLALQDALQSTLAREPGILIQQRQHDLSRADLKAQRGLFDTRLDLSLNRLHDESPLLAAQRGAAFDFVGTDVLSYSLGATKQFRSGLSISPRVELNRRELNLAPLPESRANAFVTLQQPLLRGRGAEAAAVGERAARFEADAAGLEVRHTASFGVLRTTSAYWGYVAAEEQLRIVREAEERFVGMVTQTRDLIAADQMPAAEIKQVEATLAARTAARIRAEQAYQEARQRLGLAMGLSFAEIERLPPAQDRLPEIPESGLPTLGDAALFAAEAPARRADLLAQQQRTRRSDAIVAAARNGLKPQVDLVVSGGWAGLDERTGLGGYFRPLTGQVSGMNASAAVVFSFPPANATAEGRYAQSQASSDQSRIQQADLERGIAAAVNLAVADVARSAEAARNSQRAEALYRSAIEDEEEKFRLGLRTVIDKLVTEDRLTQALIDSVSARLAYANAIVRLRYETGDLIDPADPGRIDVARLVSPPARPAAAQARP